MHSEHLTNLHPGWVVMGWLIAAAITSGVYLALVGSGLLFAGGGAVVGIGIAMAVGFFAGGLFVGVRWSDAPILHGGAITFLSVVIWFVGSLALPGSVGRGLDGQADDGRVRRCGGIRGTCGRRRTVGLTGGATALGVMPSPVSSSS
ncbi:MAG: hypothetical protein P8170_20880 [Gemmatimonadota bacterium]